MAMGIFSFLVRVKYNLNEKYKGHNENNDDYNSDNNNGSRIGNDDIDFLTKEVHYNCWLSPELHGLAKKNVKCKKEIFATDTFNWKS